MDIYQYIESGLLEGYLLDALSAVERTQVEHDLAQSNELRAVYVQMEFEMEQLAYVLEKAPSESVWEKIEQSVESKTQVDLSKSDFVAVSIKRVKKVLFWRTWAIAASVSTLFFLFLWKTSEIQKTSLSSQIEQIKQELKQSESEKTHFASMQEKLLDSNFKTIKLSAPKEEMPYLAKVMWNEITGEVMVCTEVIPDLSADQDLQLWALVDGKPVDAGVIQMNKENLSMQKMQVSKADMFAVTIEPKGGLPEPTLSKLILIGK